MFEAAKMLFIYVETPLHAGSGRGLGAVDLPIQRERVTNYPMIQASSLKGRLRAAYRSALSKENQKTEEENDKDLIVLTIFGAAETDEQGGSYAGALSVGDARLLLFPVRSLAGVFAWTTCRPVLERLQRSLEMAAQSETSLKTVAANLKAKLEAIAWPDEPTSDQGAMWALVGSQSLVAGGQVVLEEFSFKPETAINPIAELGQWLADNAFPQDYSYWKEQLPQKLCILPEDAFRDFTQFATEVQTHIKISAATKTVEGRMLWTVESLPADTVLYAPLMATPSRNGSNLSGLEVLKKLESLNLTRTQLGGDETTGQGMVALRLNGGVK
jgi:CRISPR-associated protein Cmr4